MQPSCQTKLIQHGTTYHWAPHQNQQLHACKANSNASYTTAIAMPVTPRLGLGALVRRSRTDRAAA
ncbi:hypothetical protein HaLaN_12371 [Haematococcus lacustris]|uniref:Uncharacterized protein n=1 Tax=Haematococcus lacustris TaxID=44745 RepID=A0A699Z0K3_HAELA|nr:hypothetical protein HaLaN_12371 [Haematococcus lacustris]